METKIPKLFITPEATPRARVIAKLNQIGPVGVATMPEQEWRDFINNLPREEFLELIAWCAENQGEEKLCQ